MIGEIFGRLRFRGRPSRAARGHSLPSPRSGASRDGGVRGSSCGRGPRPAARPGGDRCERHRGTRPRPRGVAGRRAEAGIRSSAGPERTSTARGVGTDVVPCCSRRPRAPGRHVRVAISRPGLGVDRDRRRRRTASVRLHHVRHGDRQDADLRDGLSRSGAGGGSPGCGCSDHRGDGMSTRARWAHHPRASGSSAGSTSQRSSAEQLRSSVTAAVARSSVHSPPGFRSWSFPSSRKTSTSTLGVSLLSAPAWR